MQEYLITSIPLLAPFSLLLFALGMLLKKDVTKSQTAHSLMASGIGIIAAIISLVALTEVGAVNSPLIGWNELGFSLRIDFLSTVILTMITIMGFVVLKFSENYMDGDPRKHVFFGRLAATIASVELLILAGNLFQILVFWMITSVCLHYLLVIYRHRPQAIAAARKKFIVARLSDLCLLASVVILYKHFGTGQLDQIFNQIQQSGSVSAAVTTATILLVLAAALKAAQFPTHGWLIEVVETPTPVSALLHAGLLNAGPYLMVRLSNLMVESNTASLMLITIGGFTALFASVVYMTQPSVKISLGYSSVAHMGFSLFLCGLGLYAAAILHVVGHSFYKAHAFLSSGSAVEEAKNNKIKYNRRMGYPLRVMAGIILSASIFIGSCMLWNKSVLEHFGLTVVGAIIVMGISQLIVQSMDVKGAFWPTLQSIIFACMVSTSFLFLEHGAGVILASEIPLVDSYDPILQYLTLAVVAVFALAVLTQLWSPRISQSPLTYSLGVHLRNGLYANVLFDRVIGSLKYEKFKWANLNVHEEPNPMAPDFSDNQKMAQEVETILNI